MTDRMNQQTCKHFLCYDIIAFAQSDMERSVCFVRKAVFLIILGLLLGLYAVAVADTECSLAPCSGSLTIPDSKYIIVTPENIGEHTDIMAVIGKTKEEIISDWEDRGVVLQAWFNSRMRIPGYISTWSIILPTPDGRHSLLPIKEAVPRMPRKDTRSRK